LHHIIFKTLLHEINREVTAIRVQRAFEE